MRYIHRSCSRSIRQLPTINDNTPAHFGLINDLVLCVIVTTNCNGGITHTHPHWFLKELFQARAHCTCMREFGLCTVVQLKDFAIVVNYLLRPIKNAFLEFEKKS